MQTNPAFGCKVGKGVAAKSNALVIDSLLTGRSLTVLGLIGILVSLIAWTLDLTGMTYACPYCRVERTAIGLLGLIIIFAPKMHRVMSRSLAVAIGGFGFGVAVMQDFTYGWLLIFQGAFKLHDPIYYDPLLLSLAAMLIIATQTVIVFEVGRR